MLPTTRSWAAVATKLSLAVPATMSSGATEAKTGWWAAGILFVVSFGRGLVGYPWFLSCGGPGPPRAPGEDVRGRAWWSAF